MPVTATSGSDIKDDLQHCIAKKAMILCQGHMPKEKQRERWESYQPDTFLLQKKTLVSSTEE